VAIDIKKTMKENKNNMKTTQRGGNDKKTEKGNKNKIKTTGSVLWL
jgi:hypothetical protein